MPFDLRMDGQGLLVTTHQHRIETDHAVVHLAHRAAREEEAKEETDPEMQEEERCERLVVILVVGHLVIQQEHEEDHDHADQTDQKVWPSSMILYRRWISR